MVFLSHSSYYVVTFFFCNVFLSRTRNVSCLSCNHGLDKQQTTKTTTTLLLTAEIFSVFPVMLCFSARLRPVRACVTTARRHRRNRVRGGVHGGTDCPRGCRERPLLRELCRLLRGRRDEGEKTASKYPTITISVVRYRQRRACDVPCV